MADWYSNSIPAGFVLPPEAPIRRQRDLIRRSVYYNLVKRRGVAAIIALWCLVAMAIAICIPLDPRAVYEAANHLKLPVWGSTRNIVWPVQVILAVSFVLFLFAFRAIDQVPTGMGSVFRLWRLRDDKRIDLVPAACAGLVMTIQHSRVLPSSYQRSMRSAIEIAAADMSRALIRMPVDGHLAERNSARRKALKEHTALVAAAIRQGTLKLDTAPVQAGDELIAMAFTILSRYTEGRWGELLDESDLAGLQPHRTHELWRLLAAVVATAVAALGIGYLNLPSAAAPILIGAVGILLFNLAGLRGPRGLEHLDSVRGIQRP